MTAQGVLSSTVSFLFTWFIVYFSNAIVSFLSLNALENVIFNVERKK